MLTSSEQTKTTSTAASNYLPSKKEVGKNAASQGSTFFPQPKLQIETHNNSYEKEADVMSDRVMSMPRPEPIRLSTIPNTVNRKCAECDKEEKLQRKESSHETTSFAPSIVHDVLSSGGKALDSGTRSFMENRFNHDFTNVRIHDDHLAAKSADSINALAYTSGNNIVFNSGQYDSSSDSGKRLLAHELTHTIQQGNERSIQRKVKDLDCAVHAYDSSNPKDTAVIPTNIGNNVIGVNSVDDMVTKVNNYIDSPDNSCKCVSRLEINGHGTDGYQSVGNGNQYVNDDKALVHDSKDEHLDKLKSIKFCSAGLFLLMGCHTGRGLGRTLLKKVSNRLEGILVGGSQHFTSGAGMGNKKVWGKGDTYDADTILPFVNSPYVNWYLTIKGKEYTITGADETSSDLPSKLKTADRIKVKTPEGEIIKIK